MISYRWIITSTWLSNGANWLVTGSMRDADLKLVWKKTLIVYTFASLAFIPPTTHITYTHSKNSLKYKKEWLHFKIYFKIFNYVRAYFVHWTCVIKYTAFVCQILGSSSIFDEVWLSDSVPLEIWNSSLKWIGTCFESLCYPV